MPTSPLRIKSATPNPALKHCLNIVASTDDGQSVVNYLVQGQRFEHMRGQLLSLTVGEVDLETGAIVISSSYEDALNRDSMTYSKVGEFIFGRVGLPPTIEHKPGLNIIHHDAWFSSIYYNDQPIALDIGRGQAINLMDHLTKLEEVILGQSDLKLMEGLLTRSGIDYSKTSPPTEPSEPNDRDIFKAMLDRSQVRYDESRTTPDGVVSQIAVMSLNEYKPIEQQAAFTFDETTGALQTVHFRTLHRNTDHA